MNADHLARHKDFVFLTTETLWETDKDGRFSFISQKGLLGRTENEIIGKRPHELGLCPSDTPTTPFLAQEPVHEAEIWAHDKNGHLRCLIVSALPRESHEGWQGARGTCRDVTEIEIRDTALANARMKDRIVGHIVRILRDDLSPEREFEAAAKALTLTLDADGCVIYRRNDEGWDAIAHYGEALPAAMTVLSNAIMNRGDATQITSKGVEWMVSRTQVHRKVNGAVAAWRQPREKPWTADDVSLIEAVANQVGMTWAQLEKTETLAERAERDPLTGLLNQRAFAEQVSERLSHGNQGHGAALVALDLDYFKAVNDHLGHQQGDAVLRQVSAVIEKAVRGGDITGRTGGDEFLLWLERTDRTGAEAAAKRILEGIGTIADSLPKLPQRLGISIGIALVRQGDTLADLIRRADATMYKAKHGGKGRVEVVE